MGERGGGGNGGQSINDPPPPLLPMYYRCANEVTMMNGTMVTHMFVFSCLIVYCNWPDVSLLSCKKKLLHSIARKLNGYAYTGLSEQKAFHRHHIISRI